MRPNAAHSSTGFTLIEVLIVLILFTVITAIVYATFSTVVNSTEMTRVDVERLRMQEYLVRSFTTNLSTVYSDILHEDANFDLVGKDYEDEDGPADSLTFASTAPLIGGFSLPGDIKLVTYEIPVATDEEYFLSDDKPRAEIPQPDEAEEESEEESSLYSERNMTISESPLMTGNTQSLNSDPDDDESMFENENENENVNEAGSSKRKSFSGGYGERDANDNDTKQRKEEAERRREERNRPRPSDYMDSDDEYDEDYSEPITNKAMFQHPYMELAVRTLDIEYFDGEEWVQEWNSSAYESQDEDTPEALGRLPWAVRLKINFAKTEEDLAYDKSEGLNEDDDVDFEMVVPVRQGQGITQHVYEVPELQNLVPGYAGSAPAPEGVDGGGGSGGGGAGAGGGAGGGAKPPGSQTGREGRE